jgi:hypothetical protein
MSSAFLDRQAQALDRLTSLYSDKPKVIAFIKALTAAHVELELTLQTMAEQTDIDIARGVNLDTIGEIVGISRIIPESIAVQFFGFEGQPGATVFGEEGQAGIGARFREELEPDTATSILADPEYRLLIRAKIAKNHGRGTCEDILAGLNYLFNAELSVVDDLGGMAIAVGIGRQLTFQEKAIVKDLDILPRPAGVRINYYSNFDYNNYFGFAGQPNAKGFGEEGDPSVGGTFAEEF